MSDNVKAWPKATGVPKTLPKQIKRPCDYGLQSAWHTLETQLGTIEAYNRLVDLCTALRGRIDEGDVKAQNPIYAKNIMGK